MAEMLVDSTKLDACLDAEADAIRAKTGDSNDLTFDFANNKGFADAIAAISGGSGSFEPFKVIGGTIIPASETKTIQIPLGNSGITEVLYALIICDDYGNWAKYKDYKRVIVRFIYDNTRGSLASGSNTNALTEINANGNLENWVNISFSVSNNTFIAQNARSGLEVYAKPSVPFVYIIMGV